MVSVSPGRKVPVNYGARRSKSISGTSGLSGYLTTNTQYRPRKVDVDRDL